MENDSHTGCIVALVALILFMALGAGLTVYELHLQHDIINPQIRQNLIDDPQTTIANRKDFHNKLSEIISADQNVITDMNNLQTCDASCDRTQLETDLNGVESIRVEAIGTYNAEADNPDTGKDLDTWMPKHINAGVLPADPAAAITFLTNETTDLQTIYVKGY